MMKSISCQEIYVKAITLRILVQEFGFRFLCMVVRLLYWHHMTEVCGTDTFGKTYSRSACQEFLRFLWNANFHHRVYKNPQSDTIISQLNPIHTRLLINDEV